MKHVYVMQAPDGSDKVGVSRNPAQRRCSVSSLSGQNVTLAFLTPLKSDPYWIEYLAHSALYPKRAYREWFWASVEEAAAAVVAAVGAVEGDDAAYRAIEAERWEVMGKAEAEKEAFLSSGVVQDMSEDALERARVMRLVGDHQDVIAWSLNVSRATISHYRNEIAQEPQPWIPPEPWTPSPPL